MKASTALLLIFLAINNKSLVFFALTPTLQNMLKAQDDL